MKKFLAFILALLMLLTAFVGCDATPDDVVNDSTNDSTENTDTEENTAELEAGYGRVSFTPNFPVLLAGDNSTRETNKVHSELYASCTAIRDKEGDTVLLFSVDILYIYSHTRTNLERELVDKLGISPQNIFVNATHTHYAPNIIPGRKAQHDLFVNACVSAAEKAIKDLSPCEVYAGTAKTEGLVYMRRFVDYDGDGKQEPEDGEIETTPNEDAYIIKFVRPAKRKLDIVLVNFSAHATCSDGGNMAMSSSWIGDARRAYEYTYDRNSFISIHVGACGDAIPTEWTQQPYGSGKLVNGVNWMGSADYGDKLAKYVSDEIEKGLTKVDVSKGIKTKSEAIYVKPDHSMDYMREGAQLILDTFNSGDMATYWRLCDDFGIDQTYEANKITEAAAMGDFVRMELSVFSVGEIGFAGFPFETLTETGREVLEGSPFKYNFVMSNTNGCFYYIANDAAYENGGYEVRSNRYARGTAEQASAKLVELLEKIYNK